MVQVRRLPAAPADVALMVAANMVLWADTRGVTRCNTRLSLAVSAPNTHLLLAVRARMDSDMSELVVEEPNISAIALDWVHSNLYWASADRYYTDDILHTIISVTNRNDRTD